MAMMRFTNPGLPVLLTGSLLTLYACSFKDFSYLDGGGGSAGTGGTGNGGASGSGVSGTGGDGGSSGSAAGAAEPTGGTSGAEAGTGGESGDGGTQAEGGEGGVPSAGNAGTGGTGGTLPVGGEGGESGSTSGGQGGTSGGSGNGGNAGNAGTAGNGGSGGNPPLVGNLLGNPGFESGLSRWTVDPPSAAGSVRYVYTQAPNPANGTGASLATWHQTQEYTLSVFQNVTGLEPGTYTFKGMLSSQRTQEAYLFARNCGGEEIKAPIAPVSYEWFEVSIPSIPVTGTSCEVGLFVHSVAEDWVNADEFSFEKDP